ncbi:YveK family protein [Lactiplantibacillus carotarum]|uniref:hypothetical protein n=1 Tax=Lactiplantibacillus carotarum TaxID=2993456 RepID=UPI00298F0B7E|nr:hypothetical protein [Lactiplantibacillus carotarum]
MKFTIEMNARLVLRIVKKYLFIVILISLIVSGAYAFLSLKMATKTYSSVSELVQNDNNSGIISPYQQFIQSDNYKRALNEKINSAKNGAQLKNSAYKIEIVNNAANQSNTPFFSISATSKDASDAQQLNGIATNVFVNNISKYLSGSNISIVTKPSKGQLNSSKKQTTKMTTVIFLAVFVILVLLSFILETTHGKIKDSLFIRDVYQFENFGVVDSTEDKE